MNAVTKEPHLVQYPTKHTSSHDETIHNQNTAEVDTYYELRGVFVGWWKNGIFGELHIETASKYNHGQIGNIGNNRQAINYVHM